jgi:leader peptidase (prepilin peptidase)/N-methyltransferase
MDVFLPAHLALRTVELPELFVALVFLWLLIIGGSVGSFLNVVVYRLPRGLSLVYPRSHCPTCGTPILARDNLPIVGWLKLRGRCRACRGWISPRYPLVELTTALVFLGLALVEPLSDGANLPLSLTPQEARNYPLWATAFYHFALFCCLLASALIAYDGESAPRRFWEIAWLIGLAAAVVWPEVRPIGLARLGESWDPMLASILTAVSGSLLGAGLGVASWPASSWRAPGRSGHLAGFAAGAVVGVFLGWQAAAGVHFLAAVSWSTRQLVRVVLRLRFDVPWLVDLTCVTLAWIFAWGPIVAVRPEFGAEAPWYLPPVAVLATLTLAWSGRTLAETARRRLHLSEPHA